MHGDHQAWAAYNRLARQASMKRPAARQAKTAAPACSSSQAVAAQWCDHVARHDIAQHSWAGHCAAHLPSPGQRTTRRVTTWCTTVHNMHAALLTRRAAALLLGGGAREGATGGLGAGAGEGAAEGLGAAGRVAGALVGAGVAVGAEVTGAVVPSGMTTSTNVLGGSISGSELGSGLSSDGSAGTVIPGQDHAQRQPTGCWGHHSGMRACKRKGWEAVVSEADRGGCSQARQWFGICEGGGQRGTQRGEQQQGALGRAAISSGVMSMRVSSVMGMSTPPSSTLSPPSWPSTPAARVWVGDRGWG